jgi:hypothetical protein
MTTRTCSIPLPDADLGLGSANWSKGLQAMSDWIWSGNLNPAAFPNNLGRFFLQIPAIFEHQLHFSTTLIFDEPSFRNGIQISGFLERPLRELVINLIGQRRRARYTMTHHAVLGTLTARKHGLDRGTFAAKLHGLLDHARLTDLFSPLERAVLDFADTFISDPKRWSDEAAETLKQLLRESNRERHGSTGAWLQAIEHARAAERGARAAGRGEPAARDAAAEAMRTQPCALDDAANERMVNAALVELAFLCLQFVALTDVFSALAIPDEDFLPDVMAGLLPQPLIERIEALSDEDPGPDAGNVPPPVTLDISKIAAGKWAVASARPTGSRVPLVSYEIDTAQAQRDKGLAVGGVQAGAWGWSFGSYFPGGLVYLLMHHPELARFEPPYSLPLLFNEDEWRNGTQTGGFVSRRMKELAFLKIYTITRARYGLEHHTMFLFNLFRDEYGVGRAPNPPLGDADREAATALALDHAERAVLHVDDPEAAPLGTYAEAEKALLAWVGCVVRHPHGAQAHEPALRESLKEHNQAEIAAGTRRLDISPGIGADAAMRRLIDHQIAELAMLTGHMDGLGRAMTILRLESEASVKAADGYLTDRPGLFEAYDFVGVTPAARTANELRLNPPLAEALAKGAVKSPVSAEDAVKTAEF